MNTKLLAMSAVVAAAAAVALTSVAAAGPQAAKQRVATEMQTQGGRRALAVARQLLLA